MPVWFHDRLSKNESFKVSLLSLDMEQEIINKASYAFSTHVKDVELISGIALKSTYPYSRHNIQLVKYLLHVLHCDMAHDNCNYFEHLLKNNINFFY